MQANRRTWQTFDEVRLAANQGDRTAKENLVILNGLEQGK